MKKADPFETWFRSWVESIPHHDYARCGAHQRIPGRVLSNITAAAITAVIS